MIHPATELRFIGEPIGHGVVATQFIPRGTITWVKDDLDQAFTAAELLALAPHYRQILDKYTYVDRGGLHVLCWDSARYMNHSCEPTSRSPGYEFEIAVRDIHSGEQITDDYGSLNVTAGFGTCRCGSPRCRRRIRPDDLLRFADQWDAELREAIPLLRQVEQPLWFLVREKAELEDVLRGRASMASCARHYRPRRRPVRPRGRSTRRAGG